MIETYLSFAALVVILVNGYAASRHGFFQPFVRTIFGAFALLAACRYWHLFTNWMAENLNTSADRLSFACFWIIFAVVYVPFQALVRTLNDELIPVYPAWAERVGGFFSGAIQGMLLSSGVILSLLPQLPGIAPQLNLTRLLLPFDEVLVKSYRLMEEKVSVPDPLSRTLLPLSASGRQGEPLQVSWQ